MNKYDVGYSFSQPSVLTPGKMVERYEIVEIEGGSVIEALLSFDLRVKELDTTPSTLEVRSVSIKSDYLKEF